MLWPRSAALLALALATLLVFSVTIQSYYYAKNVGSSRVTNSRPLPIRDDNDETEEDTPKVDSSFNNSNQAKNIVGWEWQVCPLKKCIVSFVMFGNRSLDYYGALRHAESIPYIYPGCRMILYYDDESVDKNLIATLIQNNVTVYPFNLQMLIDMGWNTTRHAFRVVRYWALNLPDWDYLMFRDLDSGVYFREKSAVEEWMNSDLPFHFMRDHPGHWWSIMGGLWGLRRSGLKLLPFNFTQRLQKFVTQRTNVTTTDWAKWTDQKFLDEEVFPVAKHHAMVHDTYYCTHESLRCKITLGFPTRRVGKLIAGHFTLEDGTPLRIDEEVPEAPVECRRNKAWVYG